ncbi:enoyl-CoA hydratase/isomerase family protein [Halocatena halophila]|uniref:enoyl-CoA hydratase/isomerase family protein n=1 Tax=Halocatena halophila TaxID=2814576 RepID=UPI002ED2F07C
MTQSDTIRHEKVADGRIAVIQLAAPERNNVLDMEVIQALGATVTAADRDDAVQGIVLTADGERFCAGADLEYLESISFEEGLRFMTAYFEALDLLRQTSKPVVAGVHGICAEGGTELVSACDLIVADETARFTQPVVGVGATAAGGGVQLLPLIVGEKRARDLLLTGRTLDATEAKAFGLINRVVPDGKATERAIELVEMIIENHSPQRIVRSKPSSSRGPTSDCSARRWPANSPPLCGILRSLESARERFSRTNRSTNARFRGSDRPRIGPSETETLSEFAHVVQSGVGHQ